MKMPKQNRIIVSIIFLVIVVFFIAFVLFKEKTEVFESVNENFVEVDVKHEPDPKEEIHPVELPEQVKVPILVYHHIRSKSAQLSATAQQYEVSPEQFENQLIYLKEHGFSTVKMYDIYLALTEGLVLPERPVVLTFDDGRDSQYQTAFPLLLEYGFTASFFPFTNAIDRPGYLTSNQLLEMAENNMEIGSHSVFHPFMTKASDAELMSETIGSKETIMKLTGAEAVVFSHPFGLSNERVNEALKNAGYVMARGLRHTDAHRTEDLFDLGAYIITGSMSQFINIVGE